MARLVQADGGGRSLLAEDGAATTLMCFFSTPQACLLRLVCRAFQAAVAAHPWGDRETVILGSIAKWRACFPRAACANVRQQVPGGGIVRPTPVEDADLVHLKGLRELNMSYCASVTSAALEHLQGIDTLNMRACTLLTDAAFQHLRGVRVLDMSYCFQPTITSAALAHLAGIEKLSIESCTQATLTDAAFAPLRGIRVINISYCPQFTDAAFAHLSGLHTLHMHHCRPHGTISDAALVHLRGIQCLVLYHTSIPFTKVGLAHLQGIARLHMGGNGSASSIAAARDLGLPVTKGFSLRYYAFRFSDTESGPWPEGAGWT